MTELRTIRCDVGTGCLHREVASEKCVDWLELTVGSTNARGIATVLKLDVCPICAALPLSQILSLFREARR